MRLTIDTISACGLSFCSEDTMSSLFQHSQLIGRQIFCLLLIVSLWRGPMPVLHDHAMLAQGSGLSRHLLQYHGGPRQGASESDHSVQPQRIHWHFARIRDVLDPNAPPEGSGHDDICGFSPSVNGLRSDCWSGTLLPVCCLSLLQSAVRPDGIQFEGLRTRGFSGEQPGSIVHFSMGRTVCLQSMSFLL